MDAAQIAGSGQLPGNQPRQRPVAFLLTVFCMFMWMTVHFSILLLSRLSQSSQSAESIAQSVKEKWSFVTYKFDYLISNH